MSTVAEHRAVRQGALALLALFGACLPSQRASAPALAGIASVLIVPVEVPPTTITPAMLRALEVGGAAHTGAAVPGDGTGIGVLTTVVIAYAFAVERPRQEAERRLMLQDLERWARSGDAWSPERVLTLRSDSILSTNGRFRPAPARKAVPLPGVTRREATWHMENWMKPRRAWFRSDAPLPRTDDAATADAILEVSAGPLELSSGSRFLQVAVKLFDARSGRLLGRRNCSATASGEATATIFRDMGARFKESYAALANRALEDCLAGIGLAVR